MEQTDKKKSRDFNIYYLNFSKVYEIAMMINNVILTKIETDNSSSFEAEYGFTSSISAQGTKDFISKFEIALKECHETEYWLELLFETDCLEENKYKKSQNQCGTIRRMLITSLKTIKSKNSPRPQSK